MSNKKKYYKKLLDKSYIQLVSLLNDKYGPAEFDYFPQKSYERFLNNEIKTLGKNRKISRTAEGLYCHHVDEDKEIMISSPDYIKMFNIDFNCQKKERLVYCNIIEHAILHIIIARDTMNNRSDRTLGLGGYINFMRPQLIDWFIHNEVPKRNWELNCYNVLSLSQKEAIKIIDLLDNFLIVNKIATKRQLKQAYDMFNLNKR